MARFIEQFMWPFQDVVRRSAERLLAGALEESGAPVGAELFLVGFAADGADVTWPVCVEPETGPYRPEDLSGVSERGLRLYEEHPDRHMIITHADSHRRRQLEVRDGARAQALKERLSELDPGHGFEVGPSARIGAYEIHPVARLSGWRSLPRLRTAEADRVPVARSMPDAVVDEVLRRCHQILQGPDPERALGLGTSAWHIQRAAGLRVASSAAALAGHPFGAALMDQLSGVSNLPYEGAPPRGELVLAARDHRLVDVLVALREPVPLDQARAARKLLEVAGGGLSLLCDGEAVHGLGRYKEPSEEDPEDIFVVRVSGTGTWQLRHGAVPLLSVAHGTATVPAESLSKDALLALAARVLAGSAVPLDGDVLWALLSRASEQVKGTMIIVSADAEGEAARLRPQATGIEPARLDDELLWNATAIDGGLLLDPSGTCHAIGVILDGVARADGDPSRGSRYNSAVRYLAGAPPKCLILVVSADGMIDVLPQLRPRTSRAEVEVAVAAVEAEAAREAPRLERFHKAWDRLDDNRFYLDEKQVARANEAWDKVNAHRAANGYPVVHHTPLAVDPEMSDEHFVD